MFFPSFIKSWCMHASQWRIPLLASCEGTREHWMKFNHCISIASKSTIMRSTFKDTLKSLTKSSPLRSIVQPVETYLSEILESDVLPGISSPHPIKHEQSSTHVSREAPRSALLRGASVSSFVSRMQKAAIAIIANAMSMPYPDHWLLFDVHWKCQQ